MNALTKSQLPIDTPPVPRGYKITHTDDGRVFATAPADRRKSRGRVPAEPKVFLLMADPANGRLAWVMADQAQTIPIRNFMIEQGLRMEIKFGMKLTGRAPKCSTILRQEFGMQGTPVSLYMQWCRFQGYTPDPKITALAMVEGELA